MNFIQCFDEKTKNELLANNYSLLNEIKISDKTIYVFANSGKKLNFSQMNISFTNRLTF